MKKIYLKDIAKNLNVSKTAVSLVLNNKGDENKISKETQERIIAYAKKYNYVPNQLARGLSRGKSETIGLIIPNISDTFYAQIAGFVEARAMEMGYTVVFSSSYEKPEKESKLIQSMLNRQVDGLIISSTQKNEEDILRLQESDFPFVLIDRHYPNLDTNYVIVDNFGGIYHATKHLLGLGRKKIGFVTIKSELDAMQQRLLGYIKALDDHGVEQDNRFVSELDQKTYVSDMAEMIKAVTTPEKRVDALLFSTHYLAREGLRALNDMDIRIPDEVAIASFSEMSAFDLVNPPITAVIQPVQKIGDLAVDILVDEMKGDNMIKTKDKRIVLDTNFKIRKSCGA
ncbi:LacI family DNA-binding transcriptional regulator [Allomuricauda sp. M10]|uniref:LacI family DNA-binding transcriptional regulator n=1 Tax=Allomuricauda sp. M10 TaxID=2683292 RepID=UPI001D19304A|nr:LacI family DNA-binding transcriptional regulator [Muricauda sp. M10]